MLNSIAPTQISFGNRKIPRYIYHFTNKSNYQTILKDGFIEPKEREISGYGIFCIELTNFIKRWKDKTFGGKYPIGKSLLYHVSKNLSDIVVLRIPTDKINHDKLFIRSQNRLEKFFKEPLLNYATYEARMFANEFPNYSNDKERVDLCRKISCEILEKHKVANVRHCIFGDTAANSSLYKKRKEAIEYIYRENIPIEYIDEVCETNIPDFINKYSQMTVNEVFTKLFKDTPESKAIELIKF